MADRITAQEAEELGFTVDRHCYPWVAYKGQRFSPTEVRQIATPEVPSGTFEFFWPVRDDEVWTSEAVGSLVGQRPRFDIAGEPAGLLTVVAATKTEGGIKLRVRRDGGEDQ